MVVLDTSALVAVLAGEPEHDIFHETIASAERYALSAANYAGTHIVIESRFGDAGTRELGLYLHELGIAIVSVDRNQAELASASRANGKIPACGFLPNRTPVDL